MGNFFSGLGDQSVLSDPVSMDCSSTLTLDDMPLDVLIHIMSYTSFNDMLQMELVSWRMRAVMRTAWKQVKGISTCTQYYSDRSGLVHKANRYQCVGIDNDTVMEVVKRADIRYLTVREPTELFKFHGDILSLSMFMPNLQRIDFLDVRLSAENIATLTGHCNQLVHVSFENCIYDAVAARALRGFFANCQHLTHVNLIGNLILEGDTILQLPKTLRHLNLSVNNLPAPMKLDIVKAFPSLEGFFIDAENCTAAEYNAMLSCLPNLRYLGIFGQITNDVSSYLDFSHNPHLEVLTAGFMDCIRSETLSTLASCKKLRVLTIENCDSVTSRVLRSLAGCKSLRVLYCSHFHTYDLRDLAYVVNSCGIQYLRISALWENAKENVSRFISSTPTLKGICNVISFPLGFDDSNYESFVGNYFDDEIEAASESTGAVDTDRPLFNLVNVEDQPDEFVANLFVRQSALKKTTFQSAEFDEEYGQILEFGSPA